MEYKTSFLYEFTKIEATTISFILLFFIEIRNCNCDKVRNLSVIRWVDNLNSRSYLTQIVSERYQECKEWDIDPGRILG